MASVDLVQVWLHDAEDFDSYVRLRARNISAAPQRQAQARRYAGGRIRVISGPARPVSISFDALQVPREDIDRLEGWLGKRLLYRDPRGRVLFCMVSALPTEELLYSEKANLSLTLESVSGTVEV